ncbi:MAG: hypothetical protein Q8P24_02385 [Desulfobacterales bacterium]|nr:hypothetical protein [Desulfobacterales bacterium]
MTEKMEKILEYEERFGFTAIKKGFITPEDLIGALSIQVREEIEKGDHRLVGKILLDQDKMSPDQIETVLKAIFQKR